MNAGLKWIDLLLDILSKETDGGPMLSQGADNLIDRSPLWGRILILGTGAIVTLHLANVLDPKYDLISQSFWKNIRRGLWTGVR